MMKATVIINTNNQNAFLKRAIHSAINQKYSNYEVIISNLSKKKDLKTEKEFKNNKKIKFLNLNEKFLHPTQNQLYAIKEALNGFIKKGGFKNIQSKSISKNFYQC